MYVDNLILLVDLIKDLLIIKCALSEKFQMKGLGELHFCLGVSVIQETGVITLHQKQYLKDILKRYGMQDSYPVSTPLNSSVRLETKEGVSKPADKHLYLQILDSLQ